MSAEKGRDSLYSNANASILPSAAREAESSKGCGMAQCPARQQRPDPSLLMRRTCNSKTLFLQDLGACNSSMLRDEHSKQAYSLVARPQPSGVSCPSPSTRPAP